MSRVRFGTFDFDLETRELRREGVPVRLQAQPAQVLSMLLASPGEVVMRETLRQTVWGDTYVDFDPGLNFCVAQIRSALGDSAESPRFIRTLPKRGYQFIAPVAAPFAAKPSEPAPPQTVRVRHSRKRLFAPIGLGVLLIVAAGLIWNSRHASVTPITVAVVRFDNDTGSPDFDRLAQGLTDTLVAELTNASGGHFAVIGNASILREPRDRRDLLAIASSLGAGYVVLGQIQRHAPSVRIFAHLIRLPQQRHLWVTALESRADDPLRLQSAAAKRIVADLVPRLVSGAAKSGGSPLTVIN